VLDIWHVLPQQGSADAKILVAGLQDLKKTHGLYQGFGIKNNIIVHKKKVGKIFPAPVGFDNATGKTA
jgi:hypothetical protein